MNKESEEIKQRICETRASLAGKFEQLEALGATVGDRIGTVADAAGQTIEVVSDTVQSVKTRVVSMQESCNVTRHVEKRPWTMVAGATALAFVGSSLQHRHSMRHTAPPQPERNPERNSEHQAQRNRNMPPAAMRQARPDVKPEPRTMAKAEPAKPRGGGLGVMFQGEIAQLRGLALGMLFGVVRDVVKDSMSKPMAQQVEGVIEGLSNRMGGKSFNGRILPERMRAEPMPDMDPTETTSAREG